MTEPLLEFCGVGKSFRIRNRSDSLRDAIARSLRRFGGNKSTKPERFVALDDVSFSVAPGEVVGIVGPNGSGKSTSLRLAAGVYQPDIGQINVRGRVSAMIELSAGFHPDLSGRANIYLAGALLGLKRREIDSVFGRIIEFADIGAFIESPVYVYSSGMAVRLGFAVAAHVPAEILLVDEVLAVGDIDFQMKCLRRMSERRAEGASIVFVSHNLAIVERFCDRVVFLHRGKVLTEGAPQAAIDAYRCRVAEEREVGNDALVANMRMGTKEVLLDDICILGDQSLPRACVSHGGLLRLVGRWRKMAKLRSVVLGVAIHAVDGALVGEARSQVLEAAAIQGEFKYDLPRFALLPGEYEVTVYVMDHAGLVTFDRHQRSYPLHVVGAAPAGEHGVVPLGGAWTIQDGKA